MMARLPRHYGERCANPKPQHKQGDGVMSERTSEWRIAAVEASEWTAFAARTAGKVNGSLSDVQRCLARDLNEPGPRGPLLLAEQAANEAWNNATTLLSEVARLREMVWAARQNISDREHDHA
jgi:hypothetical protein